MNRGYVNRYVRDQVSQLGGITYRNPSKGHAYWRCELTNQTLRDVGTPRDVNNFYNVWNQKLRRLKKARAELENTLSTQDR
jgi:hypothetical protein